MAYIRTDTKLPSGISGWYIYYDVNGKMFISSSYDYAMHTLEDVKVIRDILNECIADMEEKKLEDGIICVCGHRQLEHYIGRGSCDFCSGCSMWRSKNE